MNKEILIEKNEVAGEEIMSVSSIHADSISKLTGKETVNKDDLYALKQLGFAIAKNTLDKNGNMIYIYHNIESFKKQKDKK